MLRHQLLQITRRAVSLARARQREVCGLLLLHGKVLGLVELRNMSKRRGSFQLNRQDVSAAGSAATLLGSRVVGTFHSHVASSAEPAETDIAGAEDGALMLIIDTITREARLWRIHGARAYRLTLELV
jgi:proteasome lid subunit RPN8/RPN11